MVADFASTCSLVEGSVVMQLKGGQQVILTPGQAVYEGLFMSSTGTPAARSRSKFLVLMIKDKGRNVVRNRTQG
jgi:hypothetical protein